MTVTASNITVVKSSTTLLNDVSFTAPAGHVTALIGPNGAGKSTLLSAIAGDEPPLRGSVSLDGVDAFTADQRTLAQTRSVMLQDINVAFSFLVRDVVEMGRTPWSKTSDPATDQAVVDAALDIGGVTHLQDRDVTTLSGGERARVAFARILAQQTPIVFFDEPTAAMDVRFQQRTLGTIRLLAEHGKTVIVVLHDLQAAAQYCDHFICLREGRLVASGGRDDVYTDDVLSEVYNWPITVERTANGVFVTPGREEITADSSVLFGRTRNS